MPSPLSTSVRANSFSLLRHSLAAAVIVGHSFEVCGKKDLLQHCGVKEGVSVGGLAVNGFFVLSGFLIAGSYRNGGSPLTFLGKRARRIVPGFYAAALISLLIVGPLGSAPGYFARQDWPALAFDAATLGRLGEVRGAFAANPYHEVDGSLWSIRYEVLCYLLVLTLGITRLLGRPRVALAAAGICTIAATYLVYRGFQASPGGATWLGAARPLPRLGTWFLIGVLCNAWDGWRSWPVRAYLGLLVVAAVSCYSRLAVQFVLPWAGGLALIGLGARSTRAGHWFDRKDHPDISYGMYLYAWPIQQLLIAHGLREPWAVLPLTAAGAIAAGWLSWHLIERRCLHLRGWKRWTPPPLKASTSA